jgi:hypothetical protein
MKTQNKTNEQTRPTRRTCIPLAALRFSTSIHRHDVSAFDAVWRRRRSTARIVFRSADISSDALDSCSASRVSEPKKTGRRGLAGLASSSSLASAAAARPESPASSSSAAPRAGARRCGARPAVMLMSPWRLMRTCGDAAARGRSGEGAGESGASSGSSAEKRRAGETRDLSAVFFRRGEAMRRRMSGLGWRRALRALDAAVGCMCVGLDCTIGSKRASRAERFRSRMCSDDTSCAAGGGGGGGGGSCAGGVA